MNATPNTRPALLARAGAALAVALLAAAAAPAARAEDAREERFEKTYELPGVRKVRLQNVNGPIRSSPAASSSRSSRSRT